MPFLTANLLSRSYYFVFEFLLFLNFPFVVRIFVFLLRIYFSYWNIQLCFFWKFFLFLIELSILFWTFHFFYKSKYFEFWLALPSLIIFHDKFKYSMFTRGHGTETFRSCILLKGDNLSFFILLPSPSYIWKRQMSEVDSRLGGVK